MSRSSLSSSSHPSHSSTRSTWTELCVVDTRSAERITSPPTLLPTVAAEHTFSPSVLDGDSRQSNPISILPSPTSPSIADGMLAAFGITSPAAASQGKAC